MELTIKNLKGSVLNVVAVVIITFFLSSCIKDQPPIVNNPTSLTAVNFIQASPNEPALDVYANSTKVNSTALIYGASTKYSIIPAGFDTATFKNTATGTKVVSTTVNLLINGTYSLFLANTPASPEVVLLADTLLSPSFGNTSLRFVNLSPDAPAVDLVVKGGATLVANKPYKNFSSFQQLMGNLNYTLEVHKAGTATVLATLPAVKLETGFVYTVWLRGLVANTSTSDQLTLDIMNNAYFVQ